MGWEVWKETTRKDWSSVFDLLFSLYTYLTRCSGWSVDPRFPIPCSDETCVIEAMRVANVSGDGWRMRLGVWWRWSVIVGFVFVVRVHVHRADVDGNDPWQLVAGGGKSEVNCHNDQSHHVTDVAIRSTSANRLHRKKLYILPISFQSRAIHGDPWIRTLRP